MSWQVLNKYIYIYFSVWCRYGVSSLRFLLIFGNPDHGSNFGFVIFLFAASTLTARFTWAWLLSVLLNKWNINNKIAVFAGICYYMIYTQYVVSGFVLCLQTNFILDLLNKNLMFVLQVVLYLSFHSDSTCFFWNILGNNTYRIRGCSSCFFIWLQYNDL